MHYRIRYFFIKASHGVFILPSPRYLLGVVIVRVIVIVIMCISGAKWIICTKYYFYKMCTAERLEPTG